MLHAPDELFTKQRYTADVAVEVSLLAIKKTLLDAAASIEVVVAPQDALVFVGDATGMIGAPNTVGFMLVDTPHATTPTIARANIPNNVFSNVVMVLIFPYEVSENSDTSFGIGLVRSIEARNSKSARSDCIGGRITVPIRYASSRNLQRSRNGSDININIERRS